MSHHSSIRSAPYDAYVRQLKLPLWESACLFEAGVGRNVNGNMFWLVRTLCQSEEFSRYRPFFAVAKDLLPLAHKRFHAYGLDRVELLVVESDEYNECLARSKYLFNDNTFPAYFTKRPGQVYVNTWHGTPLKRLGLSDIRNSLRSFANVQKNLLTADIDLFSNEFTRDIFMQDFDLLPFFRGISLVHDYPRNDVLTDNAAYDRVRSGLGIAQNQQVIAYMPTWRGQGREADSEGQIAAVSAHLDEIDSLLRDNQTLYVNLHFVVQGCIDFAAYRHISPFPDALETYEFLATCDALVTDYSSVMFDFAVTGKPIYLFAYDEQRYVAEKGTYFPFRDLPFPVSHTPSELIGTINAGACEGYPEFQDRFCARHTGGASLSLLRYVLEGDDSCVSPERHNPAPIVEALYVYNIGKKKIYNTARPYILDRATRGSVLVTTGVYSDRSIAALEELRGKVHILIIVRRRVQSVREKNLFGLARHSILLSRIIEPRLRDYFQRESGQLLSGMTPCRFVALAPDGSYLMWAIKAADCERTTVELPGDPLGKKSKKLARVCTNTGYEPESW